MLFHSPFFLLGCGPSHLMMIDLTAGMCLSEDMLSGNKTLKLETGTWQNNAEQCKFAVALWERIRREFPELRIYKIWDRPIGPHTVAMFEVNLFTPAQFGAFIPWLVIHRGPLSALIHPNTGDGERDHTQLATWMGERLAVDMTVLAPTREERSQSRTAKPPSS